MRTAYNIIIYEALDTPPAFHAGGDTISIGIGLPMFIRGMSRPSKRSQHFSRDNIKPGDIYITNDSYLTGSHLNHVTLTLPIFHRARWSASPAAWRTGSTSAACSAA
jgi:N-methylhydantoinase B